VGGGIERGGNRVDPLTHNFAVADNDRGERASCAAVDVLDGERDSAAQKLGMGRG
jgi:hypothetical protein